jgi:hypothetical protein
LCARSAHWPISRQMTDRRDDVAERARFELARSC